MTQKVITVFGTRPDAIKMAPVVKELQRRSDRFDLKVVVTGQHREMLDQVLQVFEITPDYDLNVMQQGQTLGGITARAVDGLDKVFHIERPAAVVAQGDTTTTFVAALAAFYHKAIFGHVEAGLRTGNRWDPFPEEMNRLLTTRLATLHFAPTKESAQHLFDEGVPAGSVVVTGNTVIDALLAVSEKDYAPEDADLKRALNWSGRVLLVTAHRRENWGAPMERICHAVRMIVDAVPDMLVVFAMHRNPVVRNTIIPLLSGHPRVLLIEPPDYVPFVKLEQKATLVLTDSGGVQEEAPSLGKPVLVMRETTERPEGVDAGTARLVGTVTEHIYTESMKLMTSPAAYSAMAQAVSPYGDGFASKRIVDALEAVVAGSVVI